MNRPPQESKRISETQLRDFAGACFKAAGLRGDHAEQLAQLLTNGDLRGVHSHGLRQVPGYCESLRDGLINSNPNCQVLKETPSAILIDGDGGLGYAPMMMATESAIDKAKANGVAVGATCHIGHYGSAGHYVRRAMEAGCTAFSVQGGSSEFGPADPNNRPPAAYWGNPPLCFGLPGGDEPPLIPDMATCILADYQRGEEFDALQEMIPAAFFKSMGYTGVARGLGGPFVGADSARAKAVTEKWPRGQAGGMIVVIDIGLFVDPEEFRTGVDNLVRGVRETMAPLRGYDEATLPGTPESRREQEYRRDGAPISFADIERLNQTAEELGLPPTMRL